MSHWRNIIIAIIVGFVLARITGQFTTSKLPPCDLVVKGIGVSTYGCNNTASSAYPCKSEVPNSKSMIDCIQQNYYREKTFPFGFKQHFGPKSNLIDPKPLNENLVASFALGFLATIILLYVSQNIKTKSARSVK